MSQSNTGQSNKGQDNGGQSLNARFSIVSQWIARQCGRPLTFISACLVIVAWAVSGPYFHYSDTWQLIINTGTTIITFLMVFLIQNTQNRDMTALHLKLDELIRATDNARDRLMTLEDMTEEELERLKGSFTTLAGKAPEDAPTRAVAADLETARVGIGRAEEKLGISPGHAP